MAGRTQVRPATVIAGLAATLLLAVVAATSFGAVAVGPGQVVSAITRALAGRTLVPAEALVIELRLPRVVMAALVGMCLAAAGVLYQALFRNPLADPYILGVSSGAGLGAALAFVVGGSGALALVAPPVAAFVLALGTIVLVAGLATRRGVMQTLSLLLAGVAVSYTLAALTSFVLVLQRQQLSRVVFWMMGGLQGATWPQCAVVAVMLGAGLAIPLARTRELDIMLLGDERAGELGVDVETLLATVHRYNEAIERGAPDEFARTTLCGGVGTPTPISTPPYYGFASTTVVLATYCGLTVDAGARVTDAHGVPIPGLFAAGEVTGGFHGNGYVTGSSLGKSAIFGRVAGACAASFARSRS